MIDPDLDIEGRRLSIRPQKLYGKKSSTAYEPGWPGGLFQPKITIWAFFGVLATEFGFFGAVLGC